MSRDNVNPLVVILEGRLRPPISFLTLDGTSELVHGRRLIRRFTLAQRIVRLENFSSLDHGAHSFVVLRLLEAVTGETLVHCLILTEVNLHLGWSDHSHALLCTKVLEIDELVVGEVCIDLTYDKVVLCAGLHGSAPVGAAHCESRRPAVVRVLIEMLAESLWRILRYIVEHICFIF